MTHEQIKASDDSFNQLIHTAPKVTSVQAQLLLRDSYETSYDIFNHNHELGQHPFALIKMNWNEDTITNGRLHLWLKKFATAKIGSVFHISIKEFLEFPTYVCDLMYEVAMSENIRKNKEAEEALNNKEI